MGRTIQSAVYPRVATTIIVRQAPTKGPLVLIVLISLMNTMAVVVPIPIPTQWKSLAKIKTGREGAKKMAKEPRLEEKLLISKTLFRPSGSVMGPLRRIPTTLAMGVTAANQVLSSTLRWRRGEVAFTWCGSTRPAYICQKLNTTRI